MPSYSSVHPQMDMSAYLIISKTISRGYLSSGFLPVHIALPALALLFGDTVKTDDVYVETFLETISTIEATFLKRSRKYVKQAMIFPRVN